MCALKAASVVAPRLLFALMYFLIAGRLSNTQMSVGFSKKWTDDMAGSWQQQYERREDTDLLPFRSLS